MYTCLRPIMSDNLPIGRSNALIVRVSPITTHWTVGRSVLKCSAIVGNATIALPWVITEVNVPTAIAMKAHHL